MAKRDEARMKAGFNSFMVRLEVSIHYLHSILFTVSIPLWCDWKLDVSFFGVVRNVVSIPLWCDWKVVRVAMEHLARLSFNSFMVRLEVDPKRFSFIKISSFNSFMVRLEVCQ